jgi:hypothetical protein
VYLQGSSTTISEVLTEAGDVQISLDRELIDDTCFGDAGWQTNMMGLDSWSGSVTANFDTTQQLLIQAFTANATRYFYVYPDRTAMTKYYYGSIWPKLTLSLPLGLAKATMPFQGDGAFGKSL